MEKFSYSKELLLYEKNNSITNDLCDDIISIFENNNENVDIINNDDNYEKIKLYLFNEIKKNFNCYMENIDKNINIFNKDLINIDNFFKNNLLFDVKKDVINNDEDLKIINNKKLILNKKLTTGFCFYHFYSLNSFIYIFFLNDCDGNICICNKYNIRINKGKLLIIPVSWCYPFFENIKKNNIRYCIYGYLYY